MKYIEELGYLENKLSEDYDCDHENLSALYSDILRLIRAMIVKELDKEKEL